VVLIFHALIRVRQYFSNISPVSKSQNTSSKFPVYTVHLELGNGRLKLDPEEEEPELSELRVMLEQLPSEPPSAGADEEEQPPLIDNADGNPLTQS